MLRELFLSPVYFLLLNIYPVFLGDFLKGRNSGRLRNPVGMPLPSDHSCSSTVNTKVEKRKKNYQFVHFL